MVVAKNTKGNRQEYHYWDYTFQWTEKHLPASELEPWIHRCDTLADDCTEILDELSKSQPDGGSLSKKDRYALLRHHHQDEPKLTELWQEINTVPDWVDWAQIQRGQDIYWRYFVAITNAVWSTSPFLLK